MLLLAFFGAVTLVLAAVGLYAIVAYSVSQRAHEIGVRITLGALPGDIRSLVLRQGAKLAAVGVAVGLAGALAGTRLLSSLLYGVSTTDPWILGGVAALLGAVSLLASYLPARRASRTDPMEALRSS
jgi:putative ABC transport system permease protein